MQIDTAHFTPLRSLAGGALLGGATAAFLLTSGRVAGVSGVVGGALRGVRGDVAWRVAFALGLALAAVLAGANAPTGDGDVGLTGLVAAGLLVGAGTRLANGCTSGHGVCGLARASTRSLAATATFMGVAFATVFALRHGLR